MNVDFKFKDGMVDRLPGETEVMEPEAGQSTEGYTPQQSTPEPEPQEPEAQPEPTPQQEPQEAPIAQEPTQEPEQNPTPQETPSTPQEPANDPKAINELNDEGVLKYLNNQNGTAFKTFDEYRESLTKEVVKEVEKVVEKTPDYDEETTKFLNFQKETGRGLDDWVRLNENLDNKSPMELALGKIRQDNDGLNLTDTQAKILLADQLRVEVEDLSDLSDRDQLRLEVLGNKHKAALKAEQKKYGEPLKPAQPVNPDSQPKSGEMVQVAGEQIPKEQYLKQRSEYLETREAAIKTIDKDVFKVEVDGKDGKSEFDVNLVYVDEAKAQMLARTESVDNVLNDFVSEGVLDHESFAKATWWMDSSNREKAMRESAQQGYAAGVEAILKQQGNVNFDTPAKPTVPTRSQEEGYGKVTSQLPDEQMSVKFKFNG